MPRDDARPWSIPRFRVRQVLSGQVLRYDGHAFVNETLSSAATVVVQEGDSTVVAAAATIDFDASDFNVTDTGGVEANISLAYGTSAGTPAEGNHTHLLAAGATDVTASAAEVNILDGATLSTAELNLLDGVTATTAEINHIDGVTSAIQTQLDGKQPLDADLTAIAALTTTAGGRGLLTLADPNADRVLVWDDSAGAFVQAAVGTGLSISATPTLDLDTDLTDLITRWVPASASGAASLDFPEDTDNGSNRVRLQGAASTADVTVTLPATTGTLYVSGGTDVALADGGTGASLADPGADRIMFWDDSAGAVDWLTVGSGLTVTTTTLTASGSSGALTYITSASPSGSSGSSIDGCFTATYDNYLVVISNLSMSTTANLLMRVRASSSDDSGTDYSYAGRRINSSGTLSTFNASGGTSWIVVPGAAQVTGGGATIALYKPHDATTTNYDSRGNVELTTNMNAFWAGGFQDDTASYDGFTLIPASGTFSATVRVYGISDS